MSRRRLTDDESTLWTGVTRSIKPLRSRPQPATAPSAATVDAPAKPARKPKPSAVFLAPSMRPPASPALAPLGRRFRQRVVRGTETIEGRLDLHGLTQAQAHDALLRFLRTSQAGGTRTALVITGKGGSGDGERGVLKRQVPMWLKLPEFRGYVIGFEDAGLRHGGAGALYVRLRRPRGE